MYFFMQTYVWKVSAGITKPDRIFFEGKTGIGKNSETVQRFIGSEQRKLANF